MALRDYLGLFFYDTVAERNCVLGRLFCFLIYAFSTIAPEFAVVSVNGTSEDSSMFEFGLSLVGGYWIWLLLISYLVFPFILVGEKIKNRGVAITISVLPLFAVLVAYVCIWYEIYTVRLAQLTIINSVPNMPSLTGLPGLSNLAGISPGFSAYLGFFSALVFAWIGFRPFLKSPETDQ